MNNPQTVFLGFGSNVGDREQTILRAADWIAKTPGTRLVKFSPFYESPALLPKGAPVEWDVSFINAVAQYETTLSPELLLQTTQRTEKKAGRVHRGYWGPREVDIDILAYGSVMKNAVNLKLPHPRVTERDFVLLPWRDIAPDWRYPNAHGPSIAALAGRLERITARVVMAQVA